MFGMFEPRTFWEKILWTIALTVGLMPRPLLMILSAILGILVFLLVGYVIDHVDISWE